MVDYKQILRLRAEGVSQRGIAEAMGCSRNTVAAVFAAANAAGVGFEQVADLGADEVRNMLLPEPAKPDSDRAAPDFEYVHRELGRPSVMWFPPNRGGFGYAASPAGTAVLVS